MNNELTKALPQRILFFKSKIAYEKPISKLRQVVIFAKSHVKQFVRKDGTVVKEHDDKRTKKVQAAPVGREPAQQEAPAASKYGHHNVEEGDSLGFSAGSFKGQGKVKSSGKDGAVVTDEAGRDHNVHWDEVTGRGEAKKEEASAEPKKPDYAAREDGEQDKAYAKRVIDKGEAVSSLPEDHDKYFNTAGAKHVPIENLHSTKSDEENQQGGDNGPKRMQAAYHGVLGKRDPITVMPHAEKEGHYEVVDGNGTMTSGKNLGWKSLPTRVVSRDEGAVIKMEEKISDGVKKAGMHSLFVDENTGSLPVKVAGTLKSWDEINAAGPEAQSAFEDMMSKVGKALGAEQSKDFQNHDYSKPGIIYGVGPIKTFESASRKVNDKYRGDWSKIGDIVRGSIGFDTVEQLKDGIEKLKASGLKLATKPDNKFIKATDAGYRDMNLNFVMPNGIVGELQLHLKTVLSAKNEGHKDYEMTRLLDAKAKNDPPLTEDEEKDLQVRMLRQRKLYGKAMIKGLSGEKHSDDKGETMVKSLRRVPVVLFGIKRGLQ